MAAFNVSKIIEISQRSELARDVFKELADMKKSRPTTDLTRFRYRVAGTTKRQISQKELLEVFKMLQDAGVGKLVLSRDIGKAPHRFEWAHNNVEVGQAGAIADSAAPVARGHVASAQELAAPSGSIVVSYPIRGRMYAFQLPPDLSKSEAQDLCAFLSRFGR